jgi:putative colanic acid biosynthesis acetyltransferase WcaF
MDAPPSEAFLQELSRFHLPPGFRGRSAIVVQLWWIIQATLFRASPQGLYGFRRGLLRLFGAQIGTKVLIRPTVRITYPWRIKIGDHAWIGDYATLYSLAAIEIGANAVVSQHAYLCAGTHDYRSPTFDMVVKPIVVEDQAWVAARAFVHPGVRIGRGAIVGAGSVLTGSADPCCIYAGNPAKRIGQRTPR